MQYIDRHGNTLYFISDAKQWYDTLGRAISTPPMNNSTAGDFNYSVPGVGGTSNTYIFRWRALTDVRTDMTQALRYPGDTTFNYPQQQGLTPSLFTSPGAPFTDHICATALFNPVVLYQIELPNGSRYTFTYNVWGEIDKVVLPTGGYQRYQHATITGISSTDPMAIAAQANRGVIKQWVSASGSGADEVLTQFSVSSPAGYPLGTYVVTATSPNGERSERALHMGLDGDVMQFGFDDARAGRAYEERVYSATNQMLRRTLTEWTVSGPLPNGNSTATRDARMTKQVGILLDTGGDAQTAMTTMSYDADLNTISTNHYAYVAVNQTPAQSSAIGSFTAGTLLRTEEATFLVNDDTNINSTTRANYRARHLLSLPTLTRVKNASGTVVAETQMLYDESTYPLLTYTGTIPQWTDPATTLRGNVTTMRRWLNPGGTYLETHAQFDQCGSVRKAWDAKGNLSQVAYTDNFQDSVSRNSFAYPTSTTSPVPDPMSVKGSNTSLTTSTKYDFNMGLVTAATDANSQTTTFQYSDSLGRITLVTRPTGGGQTAYFYTDTSGSVSIHTQTDKDATSKLDGYVYFDGLGRTWRAARNDVSSQWSIADTQYDNLGRVSQVSNPYLASSLTGAINPSGLWTTNSYDALSRVISVTTPDSAHVDTAYSGNQVLITDQAGKQRMSQTNALGQLTDVWEVRSADSATETVSFPGHTEVAAGYRTKYAYDTLSNLVTVTQHIGTPQIPTTQTTQTRSFVYDSLSRLTSATNPESGAVSYQYDANGNLTSKTDARPITTTLTYDALNRVIAKSYSTTSSDTTIIAAVNATPAVAFYYDNASLPSGAPGYSRGSSTGRLVAMTYSGGSQGDYYGYDVLGRVTIKYQRISTTNYQVQASYNLAGAMTGETYPSSHTVSYTYDAAGRPNNFTGNLGDGTSRNYVTGTTVYNARGQMTEEQFGTGTPLFHRQRFNNRGQMYEAVLGTATTDAGLATINRGRLQNYYNTNYTVGNDWANNNGNLYLQKHFVPKDESINEWVSSSEYYSYDALNRVTSDAGLGETYLSATYQQTSFYLQSFSYDRYGNRTIDQANTWVKDGTVWVEDALPTGATGLADGGDSWNWVTSSPSPYSGTKSSQSNLATGMHQHYFTGATATMSVSTGDQLYAYIFIDPSNLPNEVMLQWHENGSWEHRAYWGANNINWGTDNTVARRSMGAIPASGRWVRLEVPASLVGLEGKTVDGIAFTLNNGKATWDRAGKSPLVNGGINNAAYTVSTANNNQLVPPSGEMQYDAVGNLKKDTFTTAHLGTRDHDGENRMTAVYNDMSVLQDSYFYDGNGKRVRRVIAGTETWQVYGIGGELLAEYGAAAPSTVQKEYGYRGGQLLVVGEPNETNGRKLQWLVTDQLGTPRMIVDSSGRLDDDTATATVKEGIVRHDYLPFGEEIGAGVGIRATNYGYGTDTVRQKFTGQERDSESGLDFFGARYFTPVQGRFTGPDDFTKDSHANDPQSWNKYAYVRNFSTGQKISLNCGRSR